MKPRCEHVREILEDLAEISNTCGQMGEFTSNDEFIQALHAIQQYLLDEVVPKEKSMIDKKLKCYCDGDGYCNCEFSENDGYNQAIAEMRERISNITRKE